MSEQLIIAQGSMGPQGLTGPIGFQGAIGVQGVPGTGATFGFPFDVNAGDADFISVGGSGQVIFNPNGVSFNGIQGNSFPPINYTFNTATASTVIFKDQNYGASYSEWTTVNNSPTRFDNTVIFTGNVFGLSGSIGFGATGPQGAQGAAGSGAQGAAGVTGPSSGWPVDASLVDANIFNIAGAGSFNMGTNGISVNGLSSSLASSILYSNNRGISYSLWFDNTNGPIQIDVPITFTNQVISTLYLNSSILFENINGGLTQAMYFNNLTSGATAAIQYSGISGSMYSLWIDNTNAPVQIDANVNFTGNITGITAANVPLQTVLNYGNTASKSINLVLGATGSIIMNPSNGIVITGASANSISEQFTVTGANIYAISAVGNNFVGLNADDNMSATSLDYQNKFSYIISR